MIAPERPAHGYCSCIICGNRLPFASTGSKPENPDTTCKWCGVELVMWEECGYIQSRVKDLDSDNTKRAITKFHLFEVIDAMDNEFAAAKAEKNIKLCWHEPELSAAQYWKVMKLESELRLARRLQSLRDNKRRITEILNGWPSDNC